MRSRFGPSPRSVVYSPSAVKIGIRHLSASGGIEHVAERRARFGNRQLSNPCYLFGLVMKVYGLRGQGNGLLKKCTSGKRPCRRTPSRAHGAKRRARFGNTVKSVAKKQRNQRNLRQKPSCLGVFVVRKKKLIFLNIPLDAHRICSTIALLDGQANNDVAWPLVSLQGTILFFYK